MKCFMCPRNCGVDRSVTCGFCNEGKEIRIAKIIHNFMWEEPPVTGKNGTCAIFFSGCNLRCNFCQNFKISRGGIGKTYSVEDFVKLLKEIDTGDEESIDLITPTHFIDYIIKALKEYRPKKKVVYNTSAYEKTEKIQELAPFVDIFLPDFKYCSQKLSKEFSNAEDYFEVASRAIQEMTKLKENLYKNGELVQGVIIRHLVIPGQVKDSIKVLEFISQNIKRPIVSIMSQFTPCGNSKIDRRLSKLEYKTVLSFANKYKLNEGYFQDISSSNEKYIPNFDE